MSRGLQIRGASIDPAIASDSEAIQNFLFA
jgi:hypothetical protein